MSDRPIIFSAPMVRALLDGRKTQTRRVLSNDRFDSLFNGQWTDSYVLDPGNAGWRDREVRYAVGDRLWVRESIHRDPDLWKYAADGEEIGWPARRDLAARKRDNLPSIHMPKVVSRLTLLVTDVRIQRLQEISEEDAIAEGVPECMEGNIGDEVYCPTCRGDGVHAALGANYGVTEVDCADCATAKQRFRNLWDSINGKRPGCAWSDNPWICAVSFDVVKANIDSLSREAA